MGLSKKLRCTQMAKKESYVGNVADRSPETVTGYGPVWAEPWASMEPEVDPNLIASAPDMFELLERLEGRKLHSRRAYRGDPDGAQPRPWGFWLGRLFPAVLFQSDV